MDIEQGKPNLRIKNDNFRKVLISIVLLHHSSQPPTKGTSGGQRKLSAGGVEKDRVRHDGVPSKFMQHKTPSGLNKKFSLNMNYPQQWPDQV